MCGRYASSRTAADLAEEFRVDGPLPEETLPADFNVAPTKPVHAVLERARRDVDGHRTDDVDRRLRVLTWGLVPSWAKDPGIGSRMINARVETVATKPAFRRAFETRRCLLPADGYYEWYPTQQQTKSGKPAKQPFFITPRDGALLAMAGLYEIWRDPERAEDDPGRFRWTCTVITTEATDDVGRIHDRMPLMVEPERWDAWLSPGTDSREVLDLLEPAAPGRLDAFPVSTRVGNVRNNDPELVAPLPLADQLPLT